MSGGQKDPVTRLCFPVIGAGRHRRSGAAIPAGLDLADDVVREFFGEIDVDADAPQLREQFSLIVAETLAQVQVIGSPACRGGVPEKELFLPAGALRGGISRPRPHGTNVLGRPQGLLGAALHDSDRRGPGVGHETLGQP